jgi:hypothetical protein
LALAAASFFACSLAAAAAFALASASCLACNFASAAALALASASCLAFCAASRLASGLPGFGFAASAAVCSSKVVAASHSAMARISAGETSFSSLAWAAAPEMAAAVLLGSPLSAARITFTEVRCREPHESGIGNTVSGRTGRARQAWLGIGADGKQYSGHAGEKAD